MCLNFEVQRMECYLSLRQILLHHISRHIHQVSLKLVSRPSTCTWATFVLHTLSALHRLLSVTLRSTTFGAPSTHHQTPKVLYEDDEEDEKISNDLHSLQQALEQIKSCHLNAYFHSILDQLHCELDATN